MRFNIKLEQKKKNIFQKLLPSIVQSTAHSEMMRKQTKKMRKTAPSPGKKAKKEKYKDKMMRIYKLTPQQYDQAKKAAIQQEKDWAHFKKEQVLKIFEPKNEYVSRSARSDVKHPTLARAKKVQLKDGQTVEVEFGRLKEFYLYNVAPDKAFVDVKTQTTHEKKLKPFKDLQKVKCGDRTGKSQAEYDQLKSVYDDPQVVSKRTIVADEHRIEPPSPEDEKYDANTTDEKHGLFPESWYALPISRSRMAKEGLTFWTAKSGAAEEELDDDPEFTVTAEKLVEALEPDAKPVKDSGVVEPTKEAASKVMQEPLSMVHERYQKTCGQQIVYLNTLKGTIDFSKTVPEKPEKTEKPLKTNKTTEEPTTEVINQITFAPTITAFVFKGKLLKRQYAGMKLVGKYVEERKDHTREAGEDTSGGS